ncbi:MAG: hypothetical protein RR911_04030 [Oscillospiraceae bacterium]
MIFGILLAIFLGGGVYSVLNFLAGSVILLFIVMALATAAVFFIMAVYPNYEPTE